MADEAPITPVVAPAPIETPVAPAVAVVAPAVEVASVAPVVVPTPAVVAEAPVVAPTPVTPVPEAPKAPETVLGEALDKKPAEAVVPSETPVEAPELKAEGQSAEPAPPPSYEPFVLPEGVEVDSERLGNLTKLLGEFELTGKVEHTSMQEFGQKLLDTHINEVKQNLSDYQKLIEKTWDDQKIAWKDQIVKDPELGGNRLQTTVDSALTFIRTHGGTPEQQTEFRNLMEASGLGNHPAMIRLLANAGRVMSEGVPLAARTPVSAPKSKISTMYGSKD